MHLNYLKMGYNIIHHHLNDSQIKLIYQIIELMQDKDPSVYKEEICKLRIIATRGAYTADEQSELNQYRYWYMHTIK